MSPAGVRPAAWLALLVAVYALRLLDGAASHSLTADEPHYLGTGLYLWETGDYHHARVLRFQPPLAFHLASLPLLAVDRDRVPVTRDAAEQLVASGALSRRALRILSRLPFVAVACWGALLVFLWAREATTAAGREASAGAAGLVAAGVYTLSPMLLAHGWIAHSDILVTVLYTQTLYAFWRWHAQPTPLRLLPCGLSLGLALVAKYSALLLLPSLLLLLLLARPLGLRERAGAALALGACCVAVIWLAYGGSFAMAAEPGSRFPELALPGWLQPFFFVLDVHASGRRIFLLGEFATHWWGLVFFPVAFAAKTPVGILVLLALSLWSLRRRPSPLGRCLGVPVAVLLAAALLWLEVPLGLRYLLPLYPLLAVFVGTQLAGTPPGWPRRAMLVAAAWAAAAGLWIHPHYLAYFNELAGGPARGHRVLLDANLDWGQDLPALAEALRERGGRPVALAYFGPEDPAHYGIQATPLQGCEPASGLVAISANVQEGLYAFPNVFRPPTPGCYAWLREHRPVARPGYSLFLYDVPPSPRPR